MSFWRFIPSEYFHQYGQPLIGAGPLWFVEVLLIFSLRVCAVAACRPVSSGRSPAVETRFPGNGAIALFALLLGVAGFLVRLVFPMDDYLFQALEPAVRILCPVYRPVHCRADRLPAQLASEPARQNGSPLAGHCSPFHPFGGGDAMGDGQRCDVWRSGKGGWHWESLTYALWESCLA